MTEDIVEEQPIIMDVSSFSNIGQKVNFLAQGIKSLEDAQSQNIYIECFTEEREEEKIKVIRFSTNLAIWTEVYPVDKIDGDVLPKSIAVNLYDFYNAIENSKDDIISFWIDEGQQGADVPELVISTFYNDNKEHEELEIRLKIQQLDFPRRKFLPPSRKLEFSFTLDQISMYNVIHQLNIENKTDGVNVVVSDRRMHFQSDYHGFMTNLAIKQDEKQVYMNDFSVFIPFYVLNLMAATGQVSDIKFDFYSLEGSNIYGMLVVETEDYNFAHMIDSKGESFELSEEHGEDYLIADPENIIYPLQMLNRINKPAKISVATIEKTDKENGEISVSYEGRYSAIARIEMAIFPDNMPLHIDSDLLEVILTKTEIDGIRIKYIDSNNIYIKYENALFIKEMAYDHVKFMKYREELLIN